MKYVKKSQLNVENNVKQISEDAKKIPSKVKKGVRGYY